MKVLLPIDGSDSANATLEWASSVLNKENTRFCLLTVISDPMIAEYRLEDANRALTDARQLLESRGYTVEKSEYVTGDPIDCICRYADEENVDQILMGSHGRSGLAKMILGSVSEGVLERCQRSVFIYRQRINKMAGSPM